jgi:heme/copper-type cytochrome/quinol oxidase subunit 4
MRNVLIWVAVIVIGALWWMRRNANKGKQR